MARQYSGTLGKVGNCQVTVNCHYAERTLAWPVATRLYLPEARAAAERRARAHVPPTVRFHTKPELALTLLDEPRASGVSHACVVADADYGDNPALLNGVAARDCPRARPGCARRVDGDGTGRRGWLLGQRPASGRTGDLKYCWSSFGPQASLDQRRAEPARSGTGRRRGRSPRGRQG